MNRLRLAFAAIAAAALVYALWHTAYAQSLNFSCTYQQAARYAFDHGNTNRDQWGRSYITITDSGAGPKLTAWSVPGVVAPANAAALPDAAASATWLTQLQADREADSDHLSRKDRAMMRALLQVINNQTAITPKITAAQLKTAFQNAYNAETP